MMRFFVPAALLCAVAISTSAQQSTTIRTETRVVLVDAIVTTKNGAYVRDLTQKDFHISEDNKEQTIGSFAFESSAEASQPRSLVLFFDQSSMRATDQIPALQSASRFIDAETGPNRGMAIVSYDGGLRVRQNFTDNAGRLKKALPGPASRVIEAEVLNAAGRRGAAAIDDTGSRNMLEALRYLGANLAVLPGRKIVVVFAGLIPSSSSQRSDLKEAVDACNKSGVAVYPVDVRPFSGPSITPFDNPNLPVPGGRGGFHGDLDGAGLGPPDSGAGAQQLLADLAGRTEGFVIRNSNDLLGGLEAVADEQDQYYALTFTPPESKEGSCHTLRVKVDRAGTNVRARNTYCVAKAPDLLAGTNMGRDLEKRAAETQAGNAGAQAEGSVVRGQSHMTASIQLPWFYAAPNVARVHLAAEITPGALKFERVKGRLHAEINLLGMASALSTAPAVAGDGGVPARFSDNLKFDFDNEAQVDAWKMKPLHYENEFRIAPGQYKFMLAFGQAGESEATFGKAESPLKIDPWNGAELGMSGLVLSRETHPAADLGLSLSIGDQTPLVAGGTQVVPLGSNRFVKSGPGFFYLEIYDPDPASVTVRVRVLDRGTADVKWDSGNTKLPLPANGGKPALPAMAKLPLDALAPGDWRLEITASDTAGRSVKHSVDFEIQ
ncbi:MAG TPA: VWA domain-containing protein [Bryobacteraceae bacterium]|jgi:VWFA-related protein|nr:VWA domain-containing protein [Bryobacteraceae bacterium]